MSVKAKWIGVVMSAALTAWGQPLDAQVFNTKGSPVRFARLWGRPTVVFYEDKDATAQNQALKDELFKRGKDAGLLDAVSVIAVANVKGFDWFPAKNFVIGAVKDAEKTSGIPVYLDWRGALMSAPWSLSEKGSTVLVIDASGEQVLFSKMGPLSPEEITRVFDLLSSLVRP